MFARSAIGVWICLLCCESALAEDAEFLPSYGDVTAIAGFNYVDSDFDNRTYATTFANAYWENGLGVHAEVAGEVREETAAYFAGGLSYSTQSIAVKGVVGTSTNNDEILPELFLRGEVAFFTEPAVGIVVTPSVTYREFRNGAEEINLGGNFTKYFALRDDRQLITQLYGSAVFADPGDNVGGFGGVDLTYGRYRRWSVGSTVEAGSSNYDSVFGAGEINNAYFSIRPHASYYVSETVELIALVSYYNTEEYDLFGGGVGVKFEFGTP